MVAITAEDAGGWNVLPFLDTIAWSEGTSVSPATRNDGYDVIVTGYDGKPNILTDYSDHPFDGGREPIVLRIDRETGKPTLKSDASGRYQIMLATWRSYHPRLGLADFSPESQDRLACRLIRERGAIPLLAASDIAGAIHACANIWASFPGNDYNQGGKRLSQLLDKFAEFRRVYTA